MQKTLLQLTLATLMLALFTRCRTSGNDYDGQSSQLFTQLSSKETNIDFNNTLKEDAQNSVLSYDYFYNGGGVAVGDVNGDGLEDIYFTANMAENKLYLNKGNFKFDDITTKANAGG